MSRAYEAKQVALDAYPDDRRKGVDLFLQFLEASEKDFIYESNMTPERYIYGDDLTNPNE